MSILVQQQQYQQQQSRISNQIIPDNVVSVKSEIIRLVKFLGQFYNEQRELQHICQDNIALSSEYLIQLERLLQQTAIILATQQYNQLSVQHKLELLSQLKQWSDKSQYIRAAQIGSASLNFDMQVYEQFMNLKRQQGLENQKQRLIYKFFLKSKANSNKNKKPISSAKKVLPIVPDFDEVDIQQQQQQQQQCFESFEFLSQSQDDSKSTAGTNQEQQQQKLQAAYARIVSKSSDSQGIQVISRTLKGIQQEQVVKNFSNNNSRKCYIKRVEKLEENIIECLGKLNLSNAAHSGLFQSSLAISTIISQDNQFFKNKSNDLIIGAIILAAAKVSDRPISLCIVAQASNTKERSLFKVFQQLFSLISKNSKFSGLSLLEPETLLADLSSQNNKIFSASSYLYQNMNVQGFLKGDSMKCVASAAVFLSGRLNDMEWEAESFCAHNNIDCEEFLAISSFIMQNSSKLLNNPALFKLSF